MTCNDFDCVLQQVAALDAAALVKIALWLPIGIYGFQLWYRWHCEDLELQERYRIGLEKKPEYYLLRHMLEGFKIILITGIPLLVVYKILDSALPGEFSRLQPLKLIL